MAADFTDTNDRALRCDRNLTGCLNIDDPISQAKLLTTKTLLSVLRLQEC